MKAFINAINYEPLPTDGSQIRLVTILPGDEGDKLECKVDNFPFDEYNTDNHEYEALSYVWGDVAATAPILLNDQVSRVTKNLEAALHALRLQDRKRLVWIDAICIDQSNTQERNQEVRRMGKIYSCAGHVIVWLGGEIYTDGEYVADKTCDLLNSLADASPNDPDSAAAILSKAGNDLSNMKLVHGFFSQPWFVRIWVLQEISLAKAATIVYGDRWIDWNRVLLAVDALRRLQLGRHTHVWRLIGAARADKVQRCWMRAHSDKPQVGSIHVELADLLWQTRFFKWSEPRDRLYAILGLVRGNLRNERLLEINYTKPVVDVFRDLSIFMIKDGMLSHVLCSIADPMENLPSWATTWMSLREGDAASRLSPNLVTYMQIYAVRELKPPPNPPRLSEDLRQLTIKGYILPDSVQHIARLSQSNPSPLRSMDELIRITHRQLINWEDDIERQSCIRRRFKTRTKRREAWKCALLHELPDGRSETSEHYDLLTDRDNGVPLVGSTPLALSAIVSMGSILGVNCEVRKPFISTSGLMGSTGANCDIHIGDKLCLFVGSAVPYVLRPVDQLMGLYRFISCCWVPELVDLDIIGGAWELQDITLT